MPDWSLSNWFQSYMGGGGRSKRRAVELSGERCTVPSHIGSALFRVVQEALTNVLRHSTARAAAVHVEVREASARVEVLDAGPGQRVPVTPDGGLDIAGSGNGLRGMRERIAALGGVVEAGPRAEGGWRVAVLLPLPPEAPGGIG